MHQGFQIARPKVTETDTTIAEDRQVSNATAPISILNDDILSHIFMLNAHLDFVDIHIPSTTIRRTSQVNQRWRDLLLNYPLVWAASLDMDDPKAWIDIVLARAGNAPLTLVIPSVSRTVLHLSKRTLLYLHLGSKTLSQVHQRDMPEFDGPSDAEVDFALSLLPRCRRFTMKVVTQNHPDIVAKMASLIVGPHLQELTLSVTSIDLALENICIWEDSDITVSQGSPAPQLKLLDLRGLRTNFLLPSFQGLTTLYIDYCSMRVPIPLTAHTCLKILGRLPQLEALALRYCLEEPTLVYPRASSENRGNSISLSSLRSLALEGHCVPCHEVLSALRFPGSCSLHILYVHMDDILHRYLVSDMMSELYRKVELSVQSVKIQGLGIAEISPYSFCMTNTSHWYKFPEASIFTISLNYTRYDTNVIPQHRIPQLIHLLRLVSPTVTDLYVKFGREYWGNANEVKSFLEPFNKVNVLAFSITGLGLRMLADIHNEIDFATDQPILPRLSMLSLYRVDIDRDSYAQAIVDLLHRRLELKAPISHIRLEDCGGGSKKETLMTKLRELDVEIELVEGSPGYGHPKWL